MRVIAGIVLLFSLLPGCSRSVDQDPTDVSVLTDEGINPILVCQDVRVWEEYFNSLLKVARSVSACMHDTVWATGLCTETHLLFLHEHEKKSCDQIREHNARMREWLNANRPAIMKACAADPVCVDERLAEL